MFAALSPVFTHSEFSLLILRLFVVLLILISYKKYSRKLGEPKAALVLMSSSLMTPFWRLSRADCQTGKAAARFGEGGREVEVFFPQRLLISE